MLPKQIPPDVTAGHSFMVVYSSTDLDPETALPIVEGSLSPSLTPAHASPGPPPSQARHNEFLTVAGQDLGASENNDDSVPRAPLGATRLSSFRDTSDPKDWRDSWNDPSPPGAGPDMAIDDVLRNSDSMVNTVKRMYQSARNKYAEYRHLSSAAAQAYARIVKAIRKAQMGGYVVGIKTPFPLPPGWEAAADPDNRVYYINKQVPVPACDDSESFWT